MNGMRLAVPVAQVFNVIVDYADEIKALLRHPSNELYAMIEEYNPELLQHDDMFEGWFRLCEKFAEANNVPLRDWIKQRPAFLFSK